MTNDNFTNDYDDGMDSNYALRFGEQGHPTAAFTPQQVKEFGLRLNAGLKNVEAGPIDPRVFEQIPEQHYDEMRRLAKLAEANPSFHAPFIDPTGFQQGVYKEGQREQSELQFKDVIRRAGKMGTETGEPVKVNIHSSQDAAAYIFSKDKELKDIDYIKNLGFVDQETGQTNFIPVKARYTGEEIEGVKKYEDPYERLDELNDKMWDQKKLALRSRDYNRQLVDDRLEIQEAHLDAATLNRVQRSAQGLKPERTIELETGRGVKIKIDPDKEVRDYLSLKASEKINEENLILESKDAFEKYLRFYEPEGREKKKEYEEVKKKYADFMINLKKQKELERIEDKKLREAIYRERDPLKQYALTKKSEKEFKKLLESKGITEVTSGDFADLLDLTDAPKQLKPIEDFSLDKSAETFANAGVYAIEQAKGNYKKAPVISIENWQPEMPFSRGDTLKELVETSRKKLAEKLREKKKLSEKEAEKAAEAVIGATWDVGHIYQLKKYGFSDEDVIEETKKIAPLLKHVHITDNFGYSDSHLPPGMGKVPIKDMLKKIKKAGYEGKYIIEAGAFAGEFKQDPTMPSAEGLGAPLYEFAKSPYWQEVRDIYNAYSMGIGEILPEQHFRQLYGGGFTQLPTELGGQSTGDRSRFSGTPLT